jgi:hypothetical protein
MRRMLFYSRNRKAKLAAPKAGYYVTKWSYASAAVDQDQPQGVAAVGATIAEFIGSD